MLMVVVEWRSWCDASSFSPNLFFLLVKWFTLGFVFRGFH